MPVIFDDNELEIAVCTFNRPQFLRLILSRVYEECVARNIYLRVVDASSSEESKDIVESFNLDRERKIGYTRVSSNTAPGYMQMEAINSSISEFVWVFADSRFVDFNEFDEKVFPGIKEGIDFIVFYNREYSRHKGKYYSASDFLHDCIVQLTCTGCSIYKKSIFDCFSENESLLKKCDGLFKDNYAFAWMGYALYALSEKKGSSACFYNVSIEPVKKNKKSTWMKRFYNCWLDDLIGIIDNLPKDYTDTDTLLQETWKRLGLDRHGYCYLGRTKGDLSEKFEYFLHSGEFERAGANINRLRFYANAPVIVIWLMGALLKVYGLFSGMSEVLKQFRNVYHNEKN